MTVKSSLLQLLNVNTEQFVCGLLNILLFSDVVGVFVVEIVREKKFQWRGFLCIVTRSSLILAACVQILANIIPKPKFLIVKFFL